MSLEKNTVVWASAGTGKTQKLVDTYVELIARGMDPMRIVAITFTEKAAAEMRQRIRSAMTTPKIVASLPAAPISTIHSFCARLLREFGLKLDIDPEYSILTEQRSLDLARESVIEVLRSEIRAEHEGISALFGDFGLHRLTESVLSAVYWLNSLGKDAGWLNERVEQQKQGAGSLTSGLTEYFDKFGQDFEAIGVLADELDAKKAKHPFKKRDDPTAPLPRIGQIAGVRTAQDLSELVAQTASRFKEKKLAMNALDFDDLLLYVRDLLRDFPEVRQICQARFQALLIDEFQDTDEVQAEIIELLAQDSTGKRRFAEGKLMVVGDPKQSIYRFRRARVTVFFRMLNALLADGGVLEHLQQNRRSAAPLAEFTNQLSDSMMTGLGKETVSDDVDVSYRIRFSQGDRLIPKSDEPFLGLTYVAADADTRAAAGREMEAEALSRLLKKWKETGVIQSWSEVAMLFRATTNMGLYVDALQAHQIPVHVVQGSYFYRKNEVSDLIALLELIVRPNDPLLRATVMTSSLAGVTFEDLLTGKASNSLDDVLQQWIDLRDRATAAEILEDVIRKTNFDVVMMPQSNGPQRVANIGKLIEITRELSREGITALDETVRHLRDRAQDMDVREAEAQISAENDNAVRVLTVHQAKGLEFGVVVVPDLAAKTARGTADRVHLSDHWGILAGAAYGLHRKPLPHSLILTTKRDDEDQQYEEEKRLLYVAVTRARRMLVLGEGFAKHGGPWLQWVHQLLEQLQPGAIERAREGKAMKIRNRSFTIDVVPASLLNIPEQLPLPTENLMIGQDALVAQFRTLLQSDFQPPASELELTPSQLTTVPDVGKVSKSNTRYGTEAHKVLQLPYRPSIHELRRRDLEDLQTVFEAPEWQAAAAEIPERELPFLLHVPIGDQNCWIRGRIDAVVFGEVPRIIDYKYSVWRIGNEKPYAAQLAIYRLAVMKSLELDRVLAELWFVKGQLKIIRFEFKRSEAELQVQRAIENYIKRPPATVMTQQAPAEDYANVWEQ